MAAEEAVGAFFEAVYNGAVEEVGALLDEDERVLESRGPTGRRPLTVAAERGHAAVVRTLLVRGADADATNNMGWTALHLAVLYLREEVVDILLGYGVDIRRPTPSRGLSPLVIASVRGYLGIVRRLLRCMGGQGLDTQTEGGGTAFWGACCEGHVEIARTLLLEGADHTIARHDGKTARMEAEEAEHHECVALIQWWEGELERAYVLHKARRGLEVPATWQAPGAPVPAYLRARAQGNRRVPEVQLRGLGPGRVTRGAAKRLQEQGGEREGPCEGEKQATLQYVMQDLAPELYIELMAGFH